MIEYRNMKRYISILSLLACVFGVNYSYASECVGEDCELQSQKLTIHEKTYDEDEYITDVILPDETNKAVAVQESTEYVIEDFADDMCDVIDGEFFEFDYNCPFETTEECEIWLSKPIFSTTSAPRNPRLNYIKMDGILATLTFNGDLSANDEMAKPLLNRYLSLMRASRTCCNEGIIYRLRKDDADNETIYNFLQDDANKYAVGARCMVLNDSEINGSYSYGVDDDMVTDVRNSCVCKNRQWIDSLLAPFYDLYQMAPDFEYMPFYYTYLDGLQRRVTVSVNHDVKNVMEILRHCPD